MAATRSGRGIFLTLLLTSCSPAPTAHQSGGSGGGEPQGGDGGSGGSAAGTGGASGGQGGSSATGGAGATGGSGATGGNGATGGSGATGGMDEPDAAPPSDGGDQPTDTSPPPPHGDGSVIGPSGFRHPGVVVNLDQLDFIKAKIAAGQQPWKGNFDALKANSHASLTYAAKPVPDVICGSFSNPSVGCGAEWSDGMAAYADALLWYFSGDEAYAKKAVEIMNAWSSTIKSHSDSNAPLQTGWAGEEWPRGAEIIRYTYKGWAEADVQRFAGMLKTVYLPGIINGSGANGNWELTMIDAVIGIGVFLDDKATFDKGVTMWHQRVPAYFYLKTDGPTPVKPPRGSPNWYGLTTYMDGVAQETCRDLTHTQYGIASTMYSAETALIQGIDLYQMEAKRLAATVEFHASFLDGAPVPSWLCGGTLNSVMPRPTWELAYNELANRLGMSLPHTKNVVAKIRPTAGDHQMSWESMTHAEVGWAGLK